jgi:hypothetical protein
MQLLPAQVDHVVNYLKRYPVVECQVCHHDDWSVSQLIFELPEYMRQRFSQGITSVNSEVFPVIPITCSTCGYVFFMSAVAVGILKR